METHRPGVEFVESICHRRVKSGNHLVHKNKIDKDSPNNNSSRARKVHNAICGGMDYISLRSLSKRVSLQLCHLQKWHAVS